MQTSPTNVGKVFWQVSDCMSLNVLDELRAHAMSVRVLESQLQSHLVHIANSYVSSGRYGRIFVSSSRSAVYDVLTTLTGQRPVPKPGSPTFNKAFEERDSDGTSFKSEKNLL